METTDYYKELFTRNQGYISEDVQEKIRRTRLLIAGCGMGSTIAEAAVRMGIETIILADLDTVAVHNLNRQLYVHADIGEKKTVALEKRLLAINPHLKVVRYDDGITQENVAVIMGQSDFVFDTIDFLSLVSIVILHDEAHTQKKPIISVVNAGFGSMAIYFPGISGNSYCDFRPLFGLSLSGEVTNESYVQHYTGFIQKIHDELDPTIASVMAQALTVMKDGKPCPAPQISAGSFATGSLATTLLVRILQGEKVTTSPHLLSVNMVHVSASTGINLSV